MATVLSNQLKAMLVMDDITEQGVSIVQNGSFTVQHFSYGCTRKRDQAGVPVGPTLPSYLDFSVRVTAGDSAKLFFERMYSQEAFPFSFLFNANFNENRRLTDCQDALVARGYLIAVEQFCDTSGQDAGDSAQMLIKGRLLLSKLIYAGSQKNLTLTITND